ncbi:14202_t:CDS:1, partial [Funneliformis caledonium]
MGIKINLFLILIIALISFLESSTHAVPLNIEKRQNDNKENNDICKKSNLDEGDGTQNRDGYCVETVLGEVPDVDNMISTLIIEPEDGSTIPANEKFRIETISENLITGFFTDPIKEYYVRPQELDDGKIIGHSHITIQKLNNDKRNVPNPENFAFFKGLDEPAQDGVLGVNVDEGLPAGNYRICTIVSSFSHQPVIMPVAQRGT